VITPIVSKHFSATNHHHLNEAKSNGRYERLNELLRIAPELHLQSIIESGLRGKGGGGAPAGAKWQLARDFEGDTYLVVNGDESEPGTFKDRQILEFDPHLLIEGMILTCYTIGAHHAYIYIRGEYHRFIARMQAAISEAYGEKLLGTDNLIGFHVDITIHSGAGAYICGEKSALLESLEGNRGHPRLKPHQKEPEFLFSQPTLVNNVETIASVPFILYEGAAAYRAYGTEKSPGTMLFALSGHINNPGVYEMAFGENMHQFITTLGGGILHGRALKAVIPGGASTPIIPASHVLDAQLDYESMRALGSALGTGGHIVMDETTNMVDALFNLIRFYHHESCGQCTPCREGCGWLEKLMQRFIDYRASTQDIDLLYSIASTMNGKTICVFAPAVSSVVEGFLTHFLDEFEARIRTKAMRV